MNASTGRGSLLGNKSSLVPQDRQREGTNHAISSNKCRKSGKVRFDETPTPGRERHALSEILR